MHLLSPVFKNGEIIPKEFTCEGKNHNPPLEISTVPTNTKSLVLLVDDPDTPMGIIWHHWVLFNIPPTTTKIETDSIPNGSIEGVGSTNTNGYQGPCPPDSKPHRYFFYLFALDILLDLPNTVTSVEVQKHIENHILEETHLIGIYTGPVKK